MPELWYLWIVPIMHDQPFDFDPLAVVHDVEKVINS